jgi:hypothetical protein
MSTIILRLLPVNGGYTAVGHDALLAAAHNSGSLTAIAVLGGLAVFVALARLLRHMLSVVSHLLSSAGAAVAVLITLLGAGTVLLTTVVVYFETH